MIRNGGLAAVAAIAVAAPAAAQTPRDLLTQASFLDRDKAIALRRVETALAQASGAAARNPRDAEAALTRATAIGYRAKLTGSRSDLASSRQQFKALVARDADSAEAQLGLGAWHLATLNRAGALLGRVLGANRSAGNAALDRAVALGGNRAFFPGLAALLRLKADPDDQRGRVLAEAASRAGTPTALDRIMQRAATAVLVPLRAGNDAETRRVAERLLPFGLVPGTS